LDTQTFLETRATIALPIGSTIAAMVLITCLTDCDWLAFGAPFLQPTSLEEAIERLLSGIV